MKTILYNPIFINPQAYYVFPNLNGQLVEQKDATIEPAKYSGIIEVKVIANGDSKLIRYYSNTNKIDLSEFKDSWIRIKFIYRFRSCGVGGMETIDINSSTS